MDFARAVLELNGHRVAHTASLHDGVSLSHHAPYPDLVLLDLDLPDGSGLEFFEQVASEVNVLVLTASTEADLARQLHSLGVRYVIKPLSARDLGGPEGRRTERMPGTGPTALKAPRLPFPCSVELE